MEHEMEKERKWRNIDHIISNTSIQSDCASGDDDSSVTERISFIIAGIDKVIDAFYTLYSQK